jgi:hypothetical protein
MRVSNRRVLSVLSVLWCSGRHRCQLSALSGIRWIWGGWQRVEPRSSSEIPRRPMMAEAGRLRTNRRAAGPRAPPFPRLAGGGAEASLCTFTGRQASGNGAHQQMGQILNCSVALGSVFCSSPEFDDLLCQDRFLSAGLPHTAFVVLSAEPQLLPLVPSPRRDPRQGRTARAASSCKAAKLHARRVPQTHAHRYEVNFVVSRSSWRTHVMPLLEMAGC